MGEGTIILGYMLAYTINIKRELVHLFFDATRSEVVVTVKNDF